MSIHDSLPKRRAPQQPRKHRSSSTETVESKLPTVSKKARRPLPRRPASLLFVRSDSYGDLILFEPVLRWIRHHWPETRVGVLLKRTYVDLTSLLVDGIDWIPVEADPLREDVEAANARGEIGRAVRVFAPELLVAPCYNKTWFEVLAGLAAPNCRQVRVGPLNLDPMTLAALARLGITIPPPIYADEVAAEELLTEVEKNHRLLDWLAGCTIPRSAPALHVPEIAQAKADQVLADLGLSERPFLVCCPAGISILSIKCWPAAAFVRVLSEIRQATSLEVLLLAHESELAILDEVAGSLRAAGLPVNLHAGASGTMPLTAGLIQRSKVYFGNDTGNLHLAAALNVPVAAVFGGGTWPRFQPTARRSVVFVNPLPCFGCGWNCHFGEALCLKVIRPEDVVQPVIRLINGQPGDPAVVTVQNVSENAFESIRASRSTYLRLQREVEQHLATVAEQSRFITTLKQQVTAQEKATHGAIALQDKLSATAKEQAGYIKVLEKERDRLKAQVAGFAQKAGPDAKVIKEQAEYIGTLEKIRDQLQQAPAQFQAGAKQHLATIAEQSRFITTLKQQVTAQEKATHSAIALQDKLSATAKEQAGYIQVLEKERDRLKAQVAGFAQKAGPDAKVIKEQAGYIGTLEKIRDQLQQAPAQFQAGAKQHLATIAEQSRFITTLKQQVTAQEKATHSAIALQDKLSATATEQADYIQVLEKERDRTTAERETAQREAKRVLHDSEAHLKDLRQQLDQLATTAREQTDYIKVQEGERNLLEARAIALTQELAARDKTLQEQLAYIVSLKTERDCATGLTGELKSQVDRLAAISREQANYTKVLEKERDRLNAEQEKAQREAQRVLNESEANLQSLQQQVDALAETTRQQADYLKVLEKDRDRLAAEAESARAETRRAAVGSQQPVDRLNAHSAAATAENQKTIDSLRAELDETVRNYEGFVGPLKQQLDQLATTAREQTDYIKVQEGERNRLEARTIALIQELAARDKTLQEQLAYIASLKTERDYATGFTGELKSQVDQLAAISREQANYTKVLEKERDRLNAEREKVQREAQRVLNESEANLQSLKQQVDALADTTRQQADYLKVLEKDRDRLATLEMSLTRDCSHYVKIIEEQTAYIRTLESQRQPPEHCRGA
jgi:ADP-heptose:LPS heptosyltransferase/chromosome segregation ATPase